MKVDRAQLAEFFRINKLKFDRCLEPHMECKKPSIQAHSIQNRQTLDLLAENGHVYSWQPRYSAEGPDIQLRLIGRNEASTFTGFCNDHDTVLFRPLDTKPLDITDREQLFLLAYRALTCELHAIFQGVQRIQTAYEARVESGRDVPGENNPIAQKATEQMLLGWATWRYRSSYYDEALLAQNYGGIDHDVIELDGQSPVLAAASFITVKDVALDQEMIGVAINVLPVSPTKTVAVFSYANQDRGAVRAALDRVLTSNGDLQKYELSKLILSRISNVVIAPSQLKSWTDAKKQKITQAFISTILSKQDAADDVDLMLF